jgi:aminoglycoside phosphotransferase (APT) family kinase protein
VAPVISAEQLAIRSDRAVRAAVEAARLLGVTVESGVVLHDVFSVVVHLRPAPLVARIQVVTPPSLTPEAQLLRQQRELDVVAWLDEQDVPVIAPSALVPRAPVRHNGFSMTFWELADVAEDHAPYAGVDVAYTADLLAALAKYPHPLPFLAPFNTGLPGMLATLTASALLTDTDIARARAEYDTLRPALCDSAAFSRAFPGVGVQPLHGDGPSHNVIRTKAGIRFSDFEDVTCGPVEWDLAMMGPETNAAYDAAALRRGLRATDPAVQRVMDAARTLQFIACVALVPELPVLAQGLPPAIEAWRASPPFARLS